LFFFLVLLLFLLIVFSTLGSDIKSSFLFSEAYKISSRSSEQSNVNLWNVTKLELNNMHIFTKIYNKLKQITSYWVILAKIIGNSAKNLITIKKGSNFSNKCTNLIITQQGREESPDHFFLEYEQQLLSLFPHKNHSLSQHKSINNTSRIGLSLMKNEEHKKERRKWKDQF